MISRGERKDTISGWTDGSGESRITEQDGVTIRSTFFNALISINLNHFFKCLEYSCKASFKSQNMFVI